MRIPIISLFFPLLTNAYTWKFTSPPNQCQNVSIAVEGSGQPPYSLLLVPSGPTPEEVDLLPIQNIPFPGNSGTLSFKLNYPENSTFVAVVSDSSGFGSGGTSAPVTVLQSSDSSCYNLSQNVQLWIFYLESSGGLGPTQCSPTRIWWTPSTVNGTVRYFGVIPGGKSFAIPQGKLSGNVTGEIVNNETGIGFPWNVNIPGGTKVLLVGSDDRGMGTGGSAAHTILDSGNSSCLDNSSPSSTPGSPAGGSYPTSTGSTPPSNGDIHSNTGEIVGGIVGGAVFFLSIALVAFFLLRRRLYSTISKERPIKVLHDDEDSNASYQDLPHDYVPNPFLVPDPLGGSSQAALTEEYPLLPSMIDANPPQTPITATTTASRKSAAPPQSPSVNIIQHDDAGPSQDLAGYDAPVTIESPPAYSNLLQTPRSPLATPTAADTV